MSSPSLELIDPTTHTSLESVPTRLTCSPPSPSLQYSLVKLMDDYVITNPTYDLGLMDIEKEEMRRGQMSLMGP